MNTEMKKEFLQKYKLDSYSRAIPSRQLLVKTVSLGEYCEPVDSCKFRRHSSENICDYNSDSEKGYALPQDAIDVRKTKPLSIDTHSHELEDSPEYELAQQTEDNAETRLRKPSPKPRSGKQAPLSSHQHTSFSEGSQAGVAQGQAVKVSSSHSASHTHNHKKRPVRKVVEIEYQVAAEIRHKKGEVAAGLGQSPDRKNNRPGKNGQPTPKHSSFSGTSATQNLHPEPFTSFHKHSVPSADNEVAYEEPWDLKMKRLKQEQENKGKKPDEGVSIQDAVPVYESAWDSYSQQKVTDNKLSYPRTISQTSETDVFHDALDSLPDQKGDKSSIDSGGQGRNSTKKLGALPQNTYEDAWDLKNSLLELKIREMQQQASAVYEEPWDSSQQQKKLHAKICSSSSVPIGGGAGNGQVSQSNKVRSANVGVVETPAGDNKEGHVITAKKYHGSSETSSKPRGHGCNIGQRINPLIPLASQNWYHGNISREDAEKMLCVCKEGSYIVRISSDRKSYSLSIKSARQYIHVQIDQKAREDGQVCYILGKNSKEFPTIPEMIDYYTHHRVPLKGAEHITLLHPVECKWS